MDSFYKIVGDITIPEEKKAELNDCVLKVLDRCGLRKIKKTKIGNSQIEASCRVKPDTKGKVTFDYSIFEKKHRKTSYYNTNTCELFTNECGFSEFGLAMMMVLTLIESYSITPCYMVRAGEITNVAPCAEIIEDLIGVRLRFPHRADIWETYLFCRNNRDQITMKLDEVVILGAFGCGAFQNKPEIVSKAAANVIGDYLHLFKIIEFAVYCSSRDSRNYDVFNRVLRQLASAG